MGSNTSSTHGFALQELLRGSSCVKMLLLDNKSAFAKHRVDLLSK